MQISAKDYKGASGLSNYSEKHAREVSASSELLGVSSLPVVTARSAEGVGLVALLTEASVLLASRGQTAQLTSVVLLGDNPVDARIVLDGGVSRVDNDNFEELAHGILANPVGVEDTHVSTSAANLLLGDGSVGAGLLELTDALVDGLSVDDTLADCSLAAAASDADTPDGVSLLGLVAHGARLVQSGRLLGTVDLGKLAVLPAADAHNKTHNIGLFLSPEFLEVLVGTHLE